MVTSKIQHVKNQLATGILRGQYQIGEKLPSTRQLASNFKVSPLTISLAFKELRHANLIDIRPGSGAYVKYVGTQSQESRRYSIGLAYRDTLKSHADPLEDTHPLLVQWLRGLQSCAKEHSSLIIPLPYRKLHLVDETSVVRKAIDSKQIDGLVIAGWTTPAEADFLNARPFPFVLINALVQNQEVPTVLIDHPYGVRLLMGHLRELGHRDVAILVYSTDQVVVHHRKEPFVRAAQQAGFESFAPEDVLTIENSNGLPAREAFEKSIVEALDRRPTAIITADEVIANRVVAECARRKLRVPEDLSLAVLGDSTPATHVHNFTRTNAFSLTAEVSRMAGDMLQTAIDGQDISRRHIVFPPSLVIGDTTMSII